MLRLLLAALMIWGAWDWARAEGWTDTTCHVQGQDIRCTLGTPPSGSPSSLAFPTPEMLKYMPQPSYLLCGHKFCDGHK